MTDRPQYRGIDHIEDSGPLVRIDSHHLPDLDALMLDVYAWAGSEDLLPEWFEPEAHTDPRTGRSYVIGGDRPTRIPGSLSDEVEVGWWRKNPCACGDEHAFDIDAIPLTTEGTPQLVKKARGSFAVDRCLIEWGMRDTWEIADALRDSVPMWLIRERVAAYHAQRAPVRE